VQTSGGGPHLPRHLVPLSAPPLMPESVGSNRHLVILQGNGFKASAAAGGEVHSQTSNPMDIVFVSAEVAPWSKTGGLGDVIGSLPIALAKRGHRVMVVAPRSAPVLRILEIVTLKCNWRGGHLSAISYLGSRVLQCLGSGRSQERR
jgi:hypothetical protein